MDTNTLVEDLARGMAQSEAIEQMSFDHIIPRNASEPPPRTAAARKSPLITKGIGFTPPVSGRHQDLSLYLTVLIKTYVELTDAGLVRDAPFRIQSQRGQILVPDILFIGHSHFSRVHDHYIEGPPDVCIEVCSPESTAADRGDKFVMYESLGVREYWLIDPVRELVNFYHLNPEAHYIEFRPDMAGRLNSRVLKGFVLDVDRLWKRVLPTTTEIVEMAQAMVKPR